MNMRQFLSRKALKDIHNKLSVTYNHYKYLVHVVCEYEGNEFDMCKCINNIFFWFGLVWFETIET